MNYFYRVLVFISIVAISTAGADVRMEQAAPDFSVVDSQGATQKLSTYKGKIIVLEWTSAHCPLAKKHYETGNMQKLQQSLAAKGVIWLTIISSAKDRPGYFTAEQANAYFKEMEAAPTAVLLDSEGTVGRLYGVKNTPTIFVIDTEGNLRYQGAIDSDNSPDPTTIPGAQNYIKAAVEELLEGRPVSTPVTKPYGCSVKY